MILCSKLSKLSQLSQLSQLSILSHLRQQLPHNLTKPSRFVPLSSRNWLTTDAIESQPLSIQEYDFKSNQALEYLYDYFEGLGDKMEIPGYEVEYAAGVLTLKIGNQGTYVINRQPPNKQIWLASPISGPKRYSFDKTSGRWLYTREQLSLDTLLKQELSKLLRISLHDLSLPTDTNQS